MTNWTRISVAQAIGLPHLYATPRGHAIVSIKRDKGWYVLEYSGGGKRYVRPEHVIYRRGK